MMRYSGLDHLSRERYNVPVMLNVSLSIDLFAIALRNTVKG